MGLHHLKLNEKDEKLLYSTIESIVTTGLTQKRGIKSDILRTGMRSECNRRIEILKKQKHTL